MVVPVPTPLKKSKSVQSLNGNDHERPLNVPFYNGLDGRHKMRIRKGAGGATSFGNGHQDNHKAEKHPPKSEPDSSKEKNYTERRFSTKSTSAANNGSSSNHNLNRSESKSTVSSTKTTLSKMHRRETKLGSEEEGMKRLRRMVTKGGHEPEELIEHLSADAHLGIVKRGLAVENLIEVAMEDEQQLKSCASLPFTLFFFLIFMIFFQQHYNVLSVYLAELPIREDLAYPAASISDHDDIYSWLEDSYFPYLWASLPEATAQQKMNSQSLYQELVGGVFMSTTVAQVQPCTDPLARHMDCFSGTQIVEPVDAFEGVRRLDGVPAAAAVPEKKPTIVPEEQLIQRPPEDDQKVDSAAAATEEAHDSSDHEEWLRELLGDGPAEAAFAGGAAELPSLRIRSKFKGQKNTRPGQRKPRRMPQPSGSLASSVSVPKPNAGGVKEREKPKAAKKELAEEERRLRLNRPDIEDHTGKDEPGHVSNLIIPRRRSLTEVRATVQKMRDTDLVREATRTISTTALVLNDNLGRRLLTFVNIEFIFSRGGTVFTDVRLVTAPLGQNTSPTYLFLGPCWIVCLIAFTWILLRRGYKQANKGGLMSEMTSFWNLSELLVVGVGWVVCCVWLLEQATVREMQTSLDNFLALRAQQGGSTEFTATETEAFESLRSASAETAEAMETAGSLVANYHVLLILRFFLAVRGQPRLALVLHTVTRAAQDLFHLMVVILIIFLAYAVSGMVLFGRRMQQFSSFKSSIATCFQITMERQYPWDDFTEQDFWTSFMWVWSFILMLVTVLVNIFLAMIFESYSHVRAYVVSGSTVWTSAKHLMNHMKHQLGVVKENSHWISNDELVAAINALRCKQITPWMLKDHLPSMSTKQVNYLFNVASEKVDNALLHKHDGSLPDMLASALLGLLRLYQAIGAGVPGPTDISLGPKDVGSSEKAHPACFLQLAEDPDEEDDEEEGAVSVGISHTFSMDYQAMSASIPKQPPTWVSSKVVPHLEQRAGELQELHATLEQLNELWTGVLNDTPDMPWTYEAARFQTGRREGAAATAKRLLQFPSRKSNQDGPQASPLHEERSDSFDMFATPDEAMPRITAKASCLGSASGVGTATL
eukprot:TRINITY_DN74630_c0_g1_i1.p1 TRINITY_DN74630_c0_g1~~TRINITY_DN74630_c0_g1_i1.p1  ORF type:complete len:1106 (+),score=248.09 TRINITY_DN74630_c0_g1_i1:83-3400(+)